VKITDKKWADKLLDGEVYLRPLSDFSDLEKRDSDANNTFRGDTSEGIRRTFPAGQEPQYLKDILGEILEYVGGSGEIVECYQQEKVYCLYCLEYDVNKREFIKPDKQLLEFGNTAIIIFDSIEFVCRFYEKLLSEYGKSLWFGERRVRYNVDIKTLSEYDEFSKSSSYSWQNEFRIAVDLSNGKADKEAWRKMPDFCRASFLKQGGEFDINLEREPITVKIGDIRDICIQVTTEDLINLNLPFEKFLSRPRVLRPFELPRKVLETGIRPVFIIE
jgi:hypothetical protein